MRSVNQIIAEHFNIAPAVVDDELPISQLHSDDLDMAEVVMEIEDECGVDLLGDAVSEIWTTGTVGDLARIVIARMSSSTTMVSGRATNIGGNPMLDAVARMLVYRSHKLVRAAPILRWMTEPSKTDPSIDEPNVTLDLGDDNVLVMPVPSNFFARGEPKVGDMLVIYDDGYKSWSPRKAFDDGYTRLPVMEVGRWEGFKFYEESPATADPSPSVKD